MNEQPVSATEKKPPLGFSSHEAAAHGKLMASALLALEVGVALAVISGQGANNFAARRGFEFMGFAIPATTLYLFQFSMAEHRPLQIGLLIKWLTTLGMFAGVVGFACILWSVVSTAGFIFAISSMLCVWLIMRAEERASDKRRRKSQMP